MRLLVINVFFDPISFGGATVVAEEMAARLFQRGIDVSAASIRYGNLPCRSTIRHASRHGFDVYSIGISRPDTFEQTYRGVVACEAIAEIIDSFKPDVAHVHCIQDIGADVLTVLRDREVPFAVTIHDCWWWCEKQFMIDRKGRYCGQEKVDFEICGACTGHAERSQQRVQYLIDQLLTAQLVLAPSSYFARMIVANGLPSDKVRVNKNGVRPPRGSGGPRLTRSDKVVFGYVGGPGSLKGWDLILEALTDLADDRIILRTVDAGAAVGQSWRDRLTADAGHLSLEIVPAYTQENIDAVFADFDVLLMPSFGKESFGLTAREALLRDVWVIASAAGGLHEDITDGQNGTILGFPPTKEELKTAISLALDRPKVALPFKDKITTLDMQAVELEHYLRAIIPEPSGMRHA